ncbi:chemotaxis protein CheW [Oceanotoga sp. DSM 15011]|jgi:purine-binding chemotaxis protein CheW|uniref:Purine-binding chemotaxis protein CheW n=1 Tax=Oceanotoga teriensis TaxID=515440 RepID=A0AA45HI35_9BACT|nr:MULTISPECIES: chemotaxis protein CheW [Oceanotoga]MDN5342288.1 purine-binding chemotaxis protein CheW [Oceanotoga sp.]MDO7977351.1 chemotaxis protein CheW [Oceanotoga teriensis]PWJ88741.1 purine-binding chemotaxis protein CheW [Oceanotoga teriensis]UYP00431.1 chemotaxis protein CheW [Oceanotoga sp. DSM 15011]
MRDVLSFQIYNQEFALEVDNIESVVDMQEITPVPNSKKFINGVINLRGRIVPVIDLTAILNLSLPEDYKFENILILKIDEEEIGVFVDEVKNVLNIDPEKLENFQSNNEIYAGKVKGIIKVNNRLIVYLDIKEVLNFNKNN